MMDHSPGQRQFASLENYARYYKKKLKLTDEEFQQFCDERIAESEKNSEPNRRAIAACARGIILASHDDATADHVAEAADRWRKGGRIPNHRRGRQGIKGSWHGCFDGSAEPRSRQFALGQCVGARPCRARLSRYSSSDYIPFSLCRPVFI